MTLEQENLEVFGRYRLLSRIGQGGMAEVYRAKSFGVEGFEKVLVIKRILPELAKSQAFVDMFIHEAKLAVRLSHANIVQVFDLGRLDRSDGASYFMAMEFVDGLDFATVLNRCKWQGLTIPVGLALYVAAEVAKGLDHAHRRRDEQNRPLGIVHRDISPQNVLLSWEGEVKVTDFGIAKARSNLDDGETTAVRELKGKYSYMSPEQARGESVDARSDLFSLGVVLYETLSGVNPFRSPTPFETLRRVQAGEFPPIEVIRPDAPPALIALVNKLLAKDAVDRFPDAARVYEELLAYLYTSGTRFGASDLAEYLSRFRDPTSGELLAAAPVSEDLQGERTPVQLPASASRLRIGEVSDSAPIANNPMQRRDVTALLVSFRPRKGAIDPDIRSRVRETLARFGGQPIDDGATVQVAALFGLGEADGRDAEYAVRAAVLVMRLLAETPVPLSIGIHSGRLLVDNTGAAERDELLSSLLGTAQELSRTGDQRIVISTAAARHVRDLVSLEPLEPGLHKLNSSQGFLVGDIRAPQEAVGAFSGRRDELLRLGKTMVDSADRRILRCIALLGEPGVGKSRLIHELDRMRRNSKRRTSLYLATCAPRGAEIPLSGVTAMLHVLCGVREGSAIEEVRAIEPDLRSLGLVDIEIEAILAQLGAPISASQGAGAPALRPALLRMMTSLASRNVQVYVWDDAQSLDAASQKLLVEIMRRLRATRTVFIFGARNAADISWLSEHDTMQLEPLPPRDAERLLALRLGVRSVPAELVAFCMKRAGEQAGLPLFLEELAHEMRESGAVVVKGVEVEQIRLDGAVAVPRPLRSLIAARIARLDAEAQLTLSAAAVLGEPIEVAPLAVMLQTSTHEIDRALATLEERACVRRTGPTTFTFTTPLLLDVVTGSLTADVQREWHGRAAVALEELLGARVDEQAHRIAAHWVDGGQREKASVFFARSAARRLASRQFEAAAAEATRALELIELDQLSVNDALALLRTLAAAVSRTRVSPAAPGLLDRLVAHVDASGNSDEQAMIRIEAARILGAIAQIDPALELLSAVHERSANAPSIAQQARLVESDLYFRKGDFNRCMLVLEDARSRGLPREQDERVLMILSQVYAALGDRDEAMSHLAQIDALPSDDPTVLADRAKAHGLVHAFLREFPQAKIYMEDAVARARGANLPLEVAVNQHNLGDSSIRLGDHSRAYAVLLQSLEACEQNSADRLASNNRVYLAYLDGLQGAADAESRIREGIQYAEGHGWTWDVVDGRYFLGRILDRRGREEDALVELKQCRDIARSVHFKLLEDDCTVAIDDIESRERNTLVPPPAVG